MVELVGQFLPRTLQVRVLLGILLTLLLDLFECVVAGFHELLANLVECRSLQQRGPVFIQGNRLVGAKTRAVFRAVGKPEVTQGCRLQVRGRVLIDGLLEGGLVVHPLLEQRQQQPVHLLVEIALADLFVERFTG